MNSNIAELIRQLQKMQEELKDSMVTRYCDIVCDYYKINADELISNTRKREILRARQMAMYMLYKHNSDIFSFPYLGEKFNKSYTGVLHSCNVINQQLLMKGFSQEKQDWENLKKYI